MEIRLMKFQHKSNSFYTGLARPDEYVCIVFAFCIMTMVYFGTISLKFPYVYYTVTVDINIGKLHYVVPAH